MPCRLVLESDMNFRYLIKTSPVKKAASLRLRVFLAPLSQSSIPSRIEIVQLVRPCSKTFPFCLACCKEQIILAFLLLRKMLGKRKLGFMETNGARQGAELSLGLEPETMGVQNGKDEEDDSNMKRTFNESLERIRKQALRNAEAREIAHKLTRPRSRPPMVMPHDPGTTYDFKAIKESLQSPVVLQDFSEPELRGAFSLLAAAAKVVRQIDEKERIMQCLSVCTDQLLGHVSEQEFWTVMVRNGLAALLFGVVPEEDSWKLLQATIDIVRTEETSSQVQEKNVDNGAVSLNGKVSKESQCMSAER